MPLAIHGPDSLPTVAHWPPFKGSRLPQVSGSPSFSVTPHSSWEISSCVNNWPTLQPSMSHLSQAFRQWSGIPEASYFQHLPWIKLSTILQNTALSCLLTHPWLESYGRNVSPSSISLQLTVIFQEEHHIRFYQSIIRCWAHSFVYL